MTRPDWTILRVNGTFEELTGLRREDLVGARRLPDLLTAGGRIYHETHLAPLLAMQGWVRTIAVEVVRADGTRLPALVSSVLLRDADGRPQTVRTAVFDATDRRSYEQELLRGRDHEREVAVELQRSMLSGAMPEGDGVELGVAYVPAVPGLEIGGDWYDAFGLDDGGLGLVVGDVVGRGIRAAATMGQLRSAVRALAATGMGPAELLVAMDGFCRRHGVGSMSTLVKAHLAPDGILRYACAGHLPPLLVEPGREPRYLWEGRSLPLDAQDEVTERAEARCTLEAGATLLLYTDGLVERSDRPLDRGMDELAAAAGVARDLDAAALPGALAAELTDPAARSDDVCVLAVRRAGV